jgi:hypothetical protein
LWVTPPLNCLKYYPKIYAFLATDMMQWE